MFNFFKYTQAKLADEIIEVCRQIVPEDEFVFDEPNATVKSDRHDIYLGNLFEQVKDKSRSERLEFIHSFVSSAISEQPIDYDSASHLLMPRIKSTAELHAWSHYLSIPVADFPHKPLTKQFSIVLGIDRNNTIHSVMKEDLQALEMTFEEALKQAMANLYQRSDAGFLEVNDGLYLADFQDGHNAARLLLTDQIEHLRVKGDPIAFIPTNDELVICGSNDHQYFEKLAGQCQEVAKHAKPLSFDTLIFKDGQWQDFYPPKTDEFAAIHNLSKIERATQYCDQQTQLQEKPLIQEHNIEVVAQALYEREDNPFFFSVCTWTEGQHGLLPISDQVHFVADIDDEHSGIIAVLSWQDTIKHFGNQMQPMSKVPERFEVSSFPDKAQLLLLVAQKD